MKEIKFTTLLIFSLSGWLCSTHSTMAQENIKLNTTPQALFERMSNNPSFRQNARGESFCWHARSGMDGFITNYLLTKDTEWLDAAVKYYDFLIGKMDTGPDGYRGWIGPYMYDNKYWIDSHVGDALLIAGMLDFAVLVLEDKQLKKKYKDKANLYVEIAKKDLVEKNDKRGTWKEDGPIGGYISYEKYMEPGNFEEWKYGKEVVKSGMSHPFNKQNDMGQVFIRLYRITGNKAYFNRAEKIFLRMKRQLQYYDDHYEWNYWEPFGPWDIDFEKRTTVHWIGINPSAGYQSREVGQMVEAYHYGIVFDEMDIKRLINTNLDVMWNKDSENPAFTNSNVAHRPAKEGGKPTGALWTSLLGFDQRIRDLYEMRFRDNPSPSPGYLLYKKTVANKPPSFERKHARKKVKLPKVEFSECRNINFAVVIPSVINKGKKSVIMSRFWNPEELEIALYSADGKNKIKSLYRGRINSFFMWEWEGTDPNGKDSYKGKYRLRWTSNGEYREYPIDIN